MNYELARKLKAAGFQGHMQEVTDEVSPEKLPWPTLSELIRACGDKFWSLSVTSGQISSQGEWYARGNSVKPGLESFGDTMEEAVANLWLKLNER